MSNGEFSKPEREVLEILSNSNFSSEISRHEKAPTVLEYMLRLKHALLSNPVFEQEIIDNFFTTKHHILTFIDDQKTYEIFYYTKSENEEHLRVTIDNNQRLDLQMSVDRNGVPLGDLTYLDDTPYFANKNKYSWYHTLEQAEKITAEIEGISFQ